MSKVLRRRMVDELTKDLEGQQNLVVLDTNGLTGHESTELRTALREGEARMKHVKNAVAVQTLKKLGVEGFDGKLKGMNAFVFGPDPLAIAKKVITFRDKNQKPKVRAGMVEGKPVDAATIEELSKLPGREELLAQLFGVFKAVTQKFVATLYEVPRSFVGTVQAVADKDKKE